MEKKARLKKNTKISDSESTNDLGVALGHFEVAEANLVKLERLWNEMLKFIPEGIAFIKEPKYEEKCHLYKIILPNLPKIDGWSPLSYPMTLYDIAQSRFDANEIQEINAIIGVDEEVFNPGLELQKYRILLNRKRRELVRLSMRELIKKTEIDISKISTQLLKVEKKGLLINIPKKIKNSLEDHIGQIATLLGSSTLPVRWSDLLRHISFSEHHDFKDIVERDWPSIKKDLEQSLYDENDPIMSNIDDLSLLVATKPKGSVPRGLKWNSLSPEDFERLIFTLISNTDGYENPQWLTATNAPDKGRDLSADYIINDPLCGVTRNRVIIQCKHWQSRSVSIQEIQNLQAQMKLWEPPRVDIHIIATTGRFTTDAVALIEKENQSDRALRIRMWPESHLEKILASKPNLIADFNLR